MADKEIEDLTAATTPLDGTELLVVAQGGNSRQVAASELLQLAGSTPMFYDISKGVPALSDLIEIGDNTKFDWTERAGVALNVKSTATMGASIGGFGADRPAGTNFHVAALFLSNVGNYLYYAPLIGIHDTVTDTTRVFGVFNSGHLNMAVMNFSPPNNRTGLSEGLSGVSGATPVWLHLKKSGSDYMFGLSHDGASPIWHLVESLTYVDSAWDKIFIGGYWESNTPSSGAGSTGISQTILCYDDDADAREMGGGATAGGGGGGGGDGTIGGVEVDIVEDDLIQGSTIIYNSTTNVFEQGPAINLTDMVSGDTLIYDSVTNSFVKGDPVPKMVTLSQTDYDALSPPDADTYYFVIEP